jgi:hypothetical protein
MSPLKEALPFSRRKQGDAQKLGWRFSQRVVLFFLAITTKE